MVINKHLLVTMPDKSIWSVSVNVVALNRAEYYKADFFNHIAKSLMEDTIPLFESDDFEIIDWAKNNMNWSDVVDHATRIEPSEQIDYNEGWINGDMKVGGL